MSNNPDASEIFRWRYERSVSEFAAGGSIDVLRASLYAIGYRGIRLENEVNYQIGLRSVMVESKLINGLPDRMW